MKLQTLRSLNPSNNYLLIGEVPITPHDEIARKIQQAHEAYQSWAALGLEKRIAILNKLYDAFSKRKQELVSIIAQEMGMPISLGEKIDMQLGLQYMRGYLDFAPQWLAPEVVFENEKEIHSLFFESKGVAGVSIPWNFPFCNFIWGVMQNLIVGNTVVFKHSEECPLTCQLIEEIMQSVGDMSPGVCNAVYGDGSDAGEYLMNSDIDLIYFTGSTNVGKHLYQVAAKKFIPAILELGGSAPGIVLEDADLSVALDSIYFNRFVNSGQTCDGLKRLIVHRTHFDKVVQSLKTILASKKIGDAQNPTTDIGPLAAERQLITLEVQVADAIKKGATIVTGGKRPEGLLGAYYQPTILTNITFDMQIWQQEVFGPALPIVPFDTIEQAIALANDTQYGLGAYIYTRNKEHAMYISSQLKTGNISINAANYVIAQDPFGGYKNSGLGREHGKHGLRAFCCTKLIATMK